MRVALTMRVDQRTHEQMKAHAYLTGEPINETLGRLVAEYLAGPGRERMTVAASEKGRVSHRVALDSLGSV